MVFLRRSKTAEAKSSYNNQTWSFRLFPARCILCGQSATGNDQTLTTSYLPLPPKDICRHCEQTLPVNTCCCSRCGLPLSPSPHTDCQTERICGECQKHPPHFDHCIAPLRYEQPAIHLIQQFKSHGHFAAGKVLLDQLISAIERCYGQDNNRYPMPDIIIPVPLHWRRQWKRGFNQSQWLANQISRHFGIPVANGFCSNIRLKRIINTPHQKGLKRQQRLTNLQNAFSLVGNIEGKRIALIDDVVTTGSTIGHISALLCQQGGLPPVIWCLARTPLEK